MRQPGIRQGAWVGAADSAGLQIAVHASAIAPTSIILSIYDSVARAHGARDRRFRVEHAAAPAVGDIARFGALASCPRCSLSCDRRCRWVEQRIGPVASRDHLCLPDTLDMRPAGFRLGLDRCALDPMLGGYAP